MNIFTKDAWKKLSPKSQGFVAHLQGSDLNSELYGIKNPYFTWTRAYSEYLAGEKEAILEIMERNMWKTEG